MVVMRARSNLVVVFWSLLTFRCWCCLSEYKMPKTYPNDPLLMLYVHMYCAEYLCDIIMIKTYIHTCITVWAKWAKWRLHLLMGL